MNDSAPYQVTRSTAWSLSRRFVLLIVVARAGVRFGTGGWAVVLAFGLPLVAAVLGGCCRLRGPRADSGTRPG